MLFGGFDGEFYNDLHTLHLSKPENLVSSNIESDFLKLLNQPQLSDITVIIQQVMPNQKTSGYQISLQKCLVLRYIYELETEFYAKKQNKLVSELDSKSISEVMEDQTLSKLLPPFLSNLYHQEKGCPLLLQLQGAHQISEKVLNMFFEFTYTKKLNQPVSGHEVAQLQVLCLSLGLQACADFFKVFKESIEQIIRGELMADLRIPAN